MESQDHSRYELYHSRRRDQRPPTYKKTDRSGSYNIKQRLNESLYEAQNTSYRCEESNIAEHILDTSMQFSRETCGFAASGTYDVNAKEKRSFEELLELISEAIPNPDLKRLTKDMIKVQDEINTSDREANRLEEYLTAKESELKLCLRKGTRSGQEIISMRKEIEKLRDEMLNCQTQHGIFRKRKTMMIEELKHIQAIEKRRYDVIVDNERDLGKVKEELEQLKFKCEDLEGINSSLMNKMKDLALDKATLENETNMLKYGNRTYLTFGGEVTADPEGSSNNNTGTGFRDSRPGSRNCRGLSNENKENSDPQASQSASVYAANRSNGMDLPPGSRMSTIDSIKSCTPVNPMSQSLNNQRILGERSQNETVLLNSSLASKKLSTATIEANSQISGKLSSTKVHSAYSTSRGFGGTGSTTSSKASKIMFTVSEDTDALLMKEMEKDRKQIENSLMSHKLKFKDKLKEARSMLQQIADTTEDV